LKKQTIFFQDLSVKRQGDRVLFHRELENGRVCFLRYGFQWAGIANCVFQDQVLTGPLFFQFKKYNVLFYFFLKVEAV